MVTGAGSILGPAKTATVGASPRTVAIAAVKTVRRVGISNVRRVSTWCELQRFPLRPPGSTAHAVDPPPASRSFVLPALQALHLDPRPRPTALPSRATTRPCNTKRQRIPALPGVPNTDKDLSCRAS